MCFVGWNWAVSKLGAVKTSFYIYIVPVVTLISAAVILKEKITFIALIGALLTLGGLFVSEGEKFISLFSGKAAVNRDEPAVSELPLD
ncbi:hypothetical protein SDC9_145150 [bioreactor metagenome]|uniref:EamA domain-containing protein n=1 Tax=bioreactor metagenome TaxID=1076179 RepID=A0A645E987_9ZZZZ